MLLTKIKTSIFAVIVLCVLADPVVGITNSINAYRGFFPSDVYKFLHVHSIAAPFIKNQGQADSRISFYRSTANGMALVTTSGELLYTISQLPEARSKQKVTSFRVQFKNGKAVPEGRARYNSLVNFYLGNAIRKSKVDLPIFDIVALGEVWPGVKVSLQAGKDNVAKYFAVQPGSNIAAIKMHVPSARRLKVASDGKLKIVMDAGAVAFQQPNAYQFVNGQKVVVPVVYQVDHLSYGFKVVHYDRHRELFIDPLVIDGSASQVARWN